MGPRTLKIDGNAISSSSSHRRFLTSTHMTSARTWHICKGCHVGYRDWKSRKHEEQWQSTSGQRKAQGFLEIPLQKKLGNYST